MNREQAVNVVKMGNKESSKQADKHSIKAAGSLTPKNHEKELTVGQSQKMKDIAVPLKSPQHSCKLEEDERIQGSYQSQK